MTDSATSLRLSTADGTPIRVTPTRLVVAGYTARDHDAVRHHIAELAAIGVPEPESVPAYYEVGADRLTTAPAIEVDSAATSGEVEPVLVRHDGRYYLAIGSDHTDRDLERSSIAASKAACPKPIGSTVIELGDPPGLVNWDDVVVRSWVDDDLYQEGTLASMLPTTQVLAEWDDPAGTDDTSLVLFGGTVPIRDGTFRYGHDWRMQLAVPGHTTLELSYSVIVRNP